MGRPVEFTDAQVTAALRETSGDVRAAAALLDCDPSLVWRRLKRARDAEAAEAAERRERERAERAAEEQEARRRARRAAIARDWRHGAECLEEDPELFFPIGNTGPALAQIEEAKGVCRRCDVVETCLRWALDTRQDAGVWGGLSEDERRNLKRREARTRRAS